MFDSLVRNLKCMDPNHKSTTLTFVRIQYIRGDNHNNRDHMVNNNCCMNSGYRPSLTGGHETTAIQLIPTQLLVGVKGTYIILCQLCPQEPLLLGHHTPLSVTLL